MVRLDVRACEGADTVSWCRMCPGIIEGFRRQSNGGGARVAAMALSRARERQHHQCPARRHGQGGALHAAGLLAQLGDERGLRDGFFLALESTRTTRRQDHSGARAGLEKPEHTAPQGQKQGATPPA